MSLNNRFNYGERACNMVYLAFKKAPGFKPKFMMSDHLFVLVFVSSCEMPFGVNCLIDVYHVTYFSQRVRSGYQIK